MTPLPHPLPDIVRAHAEDAYADELAALAAVDDRVRPPSWRLSPWAVVTYLVGGTLDDGTEITPKYIGSRRLVELAVATLATDRALLLLGVPGTAKTWVGEHLAAAVSGDSTLLVQGTSGTPEESIRYGWNYARLLAEGPSRHALVPSPVMRAMEHGTLVRIEELTRIPSDVQDALITILSEKVLPVPELDTEVQARKGFNVIATANDRDRGVNDLSAALMRRFNVVVLPLPADLDEEVTIVRQRVAQLGQALELPPDLEALDEIRRVVTIFRELRSGVTADGKAQLKSPSGTLSTAEAISVVTHGLTLAAHFGDGEIRAPDVAAGLVGAVVQDPLHDGLVWQEYLETVVKERPELGRPLPGLPRPGVSAGVGGRAAILGVRHHGPGSARAVGVALDEVQPDRVLIEGAPELDGVAALAASAAMHPPVAALVYAPDEPRRAAFYPFASFSPEWVALRWALRHGVPVSFADLPARHALAPDGPRAPRTAGTRRPRRPHRHAGGGSRLRRPRALVGGRHRAPPPRAGRLRPRDRGHGGAAGGGAGGAAGRRRSRAGCGGRGGGRTAWSTPTPAAKPSCARRCGPRCASTSGWCSCAAPGTRRCCNPTTSRPPGPTTSCCATCPGSRWRRRGSRGRTSA